jgi:hypothetical protein
MGFEALGGEIRAKRGLLFAARNQLGRAAADLMENVARATQPTRRKPSHIRAPSGGAATKRSAEFIPLHVPNRSSVWHDSTASAYSALKRNEFRAPKTCATGEGFDAE